MEQYSKIRSELYRVQLTRWADLINIRSPYTLVKAVYYIETASLFLYTTQKIIKSPNFVTFLYMTVGVIGAFLLNSKDANLFFLGVFMVFTKGTFDWADGPLARRLSKTSFLGHALDVYGAYITDMAFRISFVYYVLGYYPDLMFLFPIIAFVLLIGKLNSLADILYYQKSAESISNKDKTGRDNKLEEGLKNPKNAAGIVKWYHRYEAILDARARSIDFLLLVLLVDFVFDYDLSILLLFLAFLIVLRSVVMYAAGAYYTFNVYRGNI